MGKWRYINNQNDVEEFIKETMGMHDSVMVGLDYMAGTWGDDMATYFSGPNSKNLRVIFDSPWTDGKIEMVLRQCVDLILPVGRNVIPMKFWNALLDWKN